MYELLATELRNRVPWQEIHVLWGDERCVPPDDPRSNYGMARRTLLDHVPVPETQVHRIRGELGAEAAAAEYDRVVATIGSLDLAILGAGADGHTASLFPGQLEPDDPRWARSVRAPPGIEPHERITLTLRALNAFETALFLVTGREKAHTVAAARRGGTVSGAGPDRLVPAARVRPLNEPLWIVDRPAYGFGME
jgi:6-phosphogluconolactonase